MVGLISLNYKAAPIELREKFYFDDAQKIVFHNLLKKYNQQMSLALNLKVDNEILVKRITGRVTCSACNRTFNTFFDPPKKSTICLSDNGS